MTPRLTLALIFIGTMLVAAPGINAQPVGKIKTTCFFSRQIENWKAADAKTVYIRITPRRYFRLDLAAPCHAVTRPGAFLITKLRGSTSICTALDWDLHVAQSWRDIPQACIVKKMTELSPAEAAAIPAKATP